MSHLKRLPVDVIKVDRWFVSNLEMDSDDAAIVRAVPNLGQNLGVTVVAEDVETAAQLDLLQDQDCNMVQGYYAGCPIAAKEVPQFIASRANG